MCPLYQQGLLLDLKLLFLILKKFFMYIFSFFSLDFLNIIVLIISLSLCLQAFTPMGGGARRLRRRNLSGGGHHPHGDA